MKARVISSRSNAFVSVIVTAAAVAVLTLSGAASAREQPSSLRIKVSYADLNLESEAGIRKLHARLRSAAREACDVRPYTQTRSLALLQAASDCFDEALESAIESVNNERLTALLEKRSSSPGT